MRNESELRLLLSKFVQAVKSHTEHASLLRDSADGIEQYLAEADIPVRAVNSPRYIQSVRIGAQGIAKTILETKQGTTWSGPRSGGEVIVAQQYLCALEKIARLSAILESVLTESDERTSPIRGWSIDDLQRESDDAWPLPEHKEEVETPSPSEEEVQLPDMPQGATVLLIMPRNLGRNPSAPRGHSAMFAKADIVAEWYNGRWHIVKGAGR